MWLLMLTLGCDKVDDTGAFCAEPVPTWDTWGNAFFTQWCSSCHAADSPNRYGAPEGVSFDDADQVAAWADRIEARVLHDQTMPPGGGLTDAELRQLEEFLGCPE